MDLTALNNLTRAFQQLNQSSQRLSTMHRINRGGDDPAGLIAIEQMLSELTSIRAANDSAARAAGMIHVADSGMSQVSGLLNSIRGNVTDVAGGSLSDAEIRAKQIEIDAALEAVDRLGNYTSFGGRKLLDGSSSRLTFDFSPDLDGATTLALPNISAAALGGSAGRLSDLASGGSASLSSGNLSAAIDVLDAARDQVLEARARAGAFEKYTIESSQAVLDEMDENISAAMSNIFDTDAAAETSRLVQAQILTDAATSTLMIVGRQRGIVGALLGF
jgi:flagellin